MIETYGIKGFKVILSTQHLIYPKTRYPNNQNTQLIYTNLLSCKKPAKGGAYEIAGSYLLTAQMSVDFSHTRNGIGGSLFWRKFL